jgi:hypothetical protein
MENIIIKLNKKISLTQQVKLVSLLISMFIILLFFNIIGEENSMNIIINYIQPNNIIFILLTFFSILCIFLIEKIKDILNKIKAVSVNAFILNFAITMIIVANLDKTDLGIEFYNFTVYLLIFTLIFLIFYLKYLFLVIKVNKNVLGK